MAVMLSYPSASPGVHVHAPLQLGAGATGAALDGGLEQLFGQLLVQIQQQLTAAAGAEGEGLPIDGDSLPPEMVRADLRAQLQEGLESSDLIDTEFSQQQLEALIDSAVAQLQSAASQGEGVPPFRLAVAPVPEGEAGLPRSPAVTPVASGALTQGADTAEGVMPSGVEVNPPEDGEVDAQRMGGQRNAPPPSSGEPQRLEIEAAPVTTNASPARPAGSSAGSSAEVEQAESRESQRVSPVAALASEQPGRAAVETPATERALQRVPPAAPAQQGSSAVEAPAAERALERVPPAAPAQQGNSAVEASAAERALERVPPAAPAQQGSSAVEAPVGESTSQKVPSAVAADPVQSVRAAVAEPTGGHQSQRVSPAAAAAPAQQGSSAAEAPVGERVSQRGPSAVAADPVQTGRAELERPAVGRESQRVLPAAGPAQPGGERDREELPAEALATRSGSAHRDAIAADQTAARDAHLDSRGVSGPSVTEPGRTGAASAHAPTMARAATANDAVGVHADEQGGGAMTPTDSGRAEPGVRTGSGGAVPATVMTRGEVEDLRAPPGGGARQQVIGEGGNTRVDTEARQTRDDEPRREREPESGGAGLEVRKGVTAALRSGEGSVAASIASLLNLPQPKAVALPQNPPPVGQLQSLYQGAPPGTFAFGLPQRFGSDAWTSAASQRITLMATQRLSGAEIRLDPPELGSLHVRLTLNQDQASLSFTSPHPQVREALEQQMPRLREMLAEAGINLQQSDVSDQSSSRSRQQMDEGWERGADGGGALESLEAPPPSKALLSLVDAYV